MIPAKYIVPQGWRFGWFVLFGGFLLVCLSLRFLCVFFKRACQFLHKTSLETSGCVQYVKSHYATAVLKVLFLAQLLILSESSKQPCSGK